MQRISVQHARRLALNGQLLDARTKLPRGKEGTARVIEYLGYVQIDTIAVVQRAHNCTLWTRFPGYQPRFVDELQARDRRIFEYWGHALSYLPLSDYRFYLPRMQSAYDPHSKWEKQRFEKFGHLMDPILKRIEAEGPLTSSDFESPPRKLEPGMWHFRGPRVALEMLFGRGKVMISERRNFQRVYDLTERVLPDGVDLRPPTDDELGAFLVRRALNAYGVASEADIRNHLHAAPKELISEAVRTMSAGGTIAEVAVRGNDSPQLYALPERLESVRKLRRKKPVVRLLSPFDNLIIQRDRTARLFDFDYALECYVPAGKRQHGYFVFSILWGEELVGRLDPKADRVNRRLEVKSLLLEPGFQPDAEFVDSLASALSQFAQFNDCESVRLSACKPDALKRPLRDTLRSADR